ncbi:uncharacterized protein LOC131953022 [Physella acuta]|uniref:uncharacterized protein LOC131953022 n=1 Tax=Physella acuta TaxID=109671 RepID=UPI0027DAC839|nr:uncharacterized protein LOC131953022 [Physella acuta]
MSGADDGITEIFPHYKTYKACQSKAFITGSITLLGAAACTYLLMEQLFKKYKPNISKNWLMSLPFLVGVGSAYVITMRKTTQCQNMWMAMEERHSVLTPAQERLQSRMKTAN